MTMEEQLNLFAFAAETVEPVKAEPKSKLTPRQWALYRLIRENTEAGRKTTQEEICEKVEGYTYLPKEAGHDRCPAIWVDIEGEDGLNFSPSIQKIVIQRNFEYWIGNEDEVEDYLAYKWNMIMPRLMRYWALRSKVRNDGQCQLFDCDGKLIVDGSKARGYVEAFLNHPDFD